MKKIVMLVVLVIAFAIPAAALASPATSAYGGSGASQISAVQVNHAVEQPVAATGNSTGSLPFTGLDLGFVGVVALVLVGSGLLLRRKASSK